MAMLTPAMLNPPLTAAERAARSVFVGNIPYEGTEDQLKDIFAQVGPVVSFRLVYDRETGKPKGYGFCEYQDIETAQSAMRNLNNYDFTGRPLRVGVAAGESNKDEMKGMQQAIGSQVLESPFGDPVEPEKAPEAISKAVASLPPEQMYELMKQMKLCVQNNPNEARNMLLQNPQLAYALLQAQIVMKIVDPQVALAMLYRQSDQIPPIMPNSDQPGAGASAPGPISMDNGTGGSPANPNFGGPNIGMGMSPNMGGGPPSSMAPGPGGPMGGMPNSSGASMPVRSGMPMDIDRERSPMSGPLMGRPPMGGPPMGGPPMGIPRPSVPPLMSQQVQQPPWNSDRGAPGPGASPDIQGNGPPPGPMGMGRGMPPSNHPDLSPRGGRDPRGLDPRGSAVAMDPRERMDQRDRPGGIMDPRDRGMDRRGAGPPEGPAERGMDPRGGMAGPVRGGLGPSTTPAPSGPPAALPVRPPTSSAPTGMASVGSDSPTTVPAGQDQEKAALIMQVLQLSDAQIAMLPPDQRQSILILKQQIAGGQQ